MTSRYDQIAGNLSIVQGQIKSAAQACARKYEDITLIAVTKTFPVSDVHILASLDVHHYGENRDSDAITKAAAVPGTWHFQGQIQSNKLKSIAAWADVLHSIDDISHASKLNSLVTSKDIFVQVSLDNQPNRGGVLPDLVPEFLEQVSAFANLNILGLMAVAPLDEEPVSAFSRLKALSDRTVKTHPKANRISAGMSNDFEAAISQGATHIRIGSQILGVR